MKPTLTQLISEGKTLVSDGAWGTFLQAKGLQAGECPELWNIEKPEAVLDTVELIMELESEFGVQIPDEDAEKINKSQGIYLTEFQGLSVAKMSELRREFRKVGS